jgi:hypothetical protein
MQDAQEKLVLLPRGQSGVRALHVQQPPPLPQQQQQHTSLLPAMLLLVMVPHQWLSG